jgi:hypothetical protein
LRCAHPFHRRDGNHRIVRGDVLRHWRASSSDLPPEPGQVPNLLNQARTDTIDPDVMFCILGLISISSVRVSASRLHR